MKPLESFDDLIKVVNAVAGALAPLPPDQRRMVVDQVGLKLAFEDLTRDAQQRADLERLLARQATTLGGDS